MPRRAAMAAAAIAAVLLLAAAAPAAARSFSAGHELTGPTRGLLQTDQTACCSRVNVSATGTGASAICGSSGVTLFLPTAQGSPQDAELTVVPSGTNNVVLGPLSSLSSTTCFAGKSATWGKPESDKIDLSTPDTGVIVPNTCDGGACSAPATRGNDNSGTIGISGRHSCTIHVDGTVWCSGNNEFGQLGNGATSTNTASFSTPAQVPGMPVTTFISAGGAAATGGNINNRNGHTCACTATGAAWCWGDGRKGQLGNAAASSSQTIPIQVQVNTPSGALTNCASISVSGTHSCFVTTTGALYCAGDNSKGQLGVGSTPASSSTALLVSSTNFGNSPVVSVGTGSTGFTCVVASNGRVYCVGANSRGQLGTGGTTDTSNWAEVSGGITDATAIAVGDSHTCVLRASGTVYCWGLDLGANGGSGNALPTPTLITGLPPSATRVTAGADHTCAVFVDSAIWCWGDKKNGRLGEGSTTGSGQPASAATVLNALVPGPLTVTAGSASTCVIDAAGDRKCVGDNTVGQLGNGGIAVNNAAAQTTLGGPWRGPPSAFIVVTGGSQAACTLSLTLSITYTGTCSACNTCDTCSAGAPAITTTLVTSMPAAADLSRTASVTFNVAPTDVFTGATMSCSATNGTTVLPVLALTAAANQNVSYDFPQPGPWNLTCTTTACGGQSATSAPLEITIVPFEPSPALCNPPVVGCVSCTDDALTTCIECGDGFQLVDGICVCAPGTGGSTAGFECSTCNVGFWSEGGNTTVRYPDCTSCSSAFTTAAIGSTNQDNCTLCRPGRCGQLCGRCRAGSYAPASNATDPRPECVVCPIPFTSVVQGASFPDCKACRPGYGGPSCDTCGNGRFSAGGTFNINRPDCLDCPVGTWHTLSTAASSLSCTKCKPGYGGSTCTICPPNSYGVGYTTTVSRAACTPCPPGKTSSAGSTQPSDCT
ncbi:MAG: regulator of chromosome condensation 1/beta-lactamase-inhibitor protein II [Monoraphidium minutum]|nr:MAG: regulator of chromosome condensation 1/beta-lactamase-inhibitor protein II [Monoraphidium minutum]